MTHNLPSIQKSRRAGFNLTVAIAAVMGLLGVPIVWGDLAIVTVKNAEVYRHNRVQGALLKDEIVYAEAIEGDRDWLHVFIDGERYQARRKHFLSETDVGIHYQRDKIHLESRLAQIDRRLQSHAERLLELRHYILQVEWDQTATYQVPVIVERQPLPGERPSRSVLMSGQAPPRIHYKYYDKISAGKGRKLVKEWEGESQKLTQEFAAMLVERQKLVGEQLANRLRYQALTQQFQRFLADNHTYQKEVHLVVGSSAALFQNRVKRWELEEGDLVVAQPDKKYNDRLNVFYSGQVFDSPRASYLSWTDWEINDAIVTAQQEDRIAGINRRIEWLEHQVADYQDYIDDLNYVANLNDEYISFHHRDRRERPSPRPHYWVICPADGREMVHRPRALRLLKKWREERASCQQAITNQWRTVEELNQQLLTLQVKRNDVLTRSHAFGFSAAR